MPKLRGCTAAKELLRNSSGEQDYLYNGKELEEDLKLNWYAYGFRYYDASIGRFTGVDPLAEAFPDQSSYLYAYDAPVRMVDVDGLYGDEGEANKQRQAAVDQGLKVGDSYQSGDEWGFNVVNGENSYSAFKWDFAGENETYAQLAERDFVPGLGSVEGNYGNQNTVEALGCFAHLSTDVLEIVILTQGGGAKTPKGFNPALPKAAAKGGLQYSDDFVKAAQKLYPNKAGKIELHHPIPQYLGGAKSQKLVPLDGAYHQQITNEFRRIHPYGSPKPSPQRLQEIMNEVYSKFPLPGK